MMNQSTEPTRPGQVLLSIREWAAGKAMAYADAVERLRQVCPARLLMVKGDWFLAVSADELATFWDLLTRWHASQWNAAEPNRG